MSVKEEKTFNKLKMGTDGRTDGIKYILFITLLTPACPGLPLGPDPRDTFFLSLKAQDLRPSITTVT